MAEKENLIYFETSAKSGEGVFDMMYTCIAKLPFFDQYKIENKEILVKELKSGNSNINDGGKVYNVNSDKNYVNEENSSNIILTKQKNNGNYDENKKKCGCWNNYILFIFCFYLIRMLCMLYIKNLFVNKYI